METTIGRTRKGRTHTSEEEEENRMLKKKMQTTLGRKRKERTHTSEEEEEENCRQTKKEKSKIDVSFSKRRKGLFGKAARLCKDFNDTRIAVLVVSKASRPYAFGHSSVDEVLNDLYHIQPTTTESVEGLNLMRHQHEQKMLMVVKEEIENELRACQTVEGLASLREKYLKLDEDIKKRLRSCSSEEISFEGGVIDQKYNIDIINNVGDEECSLGSRHESNYNNFSRAGGLRLDGDTGGEGYCSGLGHRDSTTGFRGNSLLASTESDYGIHNDGLTINGDIDGDGCSLRLWHDVGDNSLLASTNYSVNDGGLGLGREVSGNSLRDLTTGINGNSLCSTTSNYGDDAALRLNGDINGDGCSSGLWHEASDNSLRDSTTDIRGNVLLASTTSNYGVDGDLRLNGDIDAEGCSLGLWHEVSDNALRDSSTDISGNVLLASTTSNNGVDGDFRLNGDMDAEGCSLGFWYEVSDNPMGDSTTDTIGNVLLAPTTSNDGVDGGLRLNGGTDADEGFSLGLGHEVYGNSLGDFKISGDFDDSPLAWVCSSSNGALETLESSSDFVQSNTNKGCYSYLMEGDIDSGPHSYQDSCATF